MQWRGRDRRKLSFNDEEITRLTSRSCGGFPGIGRTLPSRHFRNVLPLVIAILPSGSGCLSCLPDLGSVPQIEVLVPRAFLGRRERRFLLHWFRRRHLGLLLASLHPEIPPIKTGGNRTIPALLNAYVGPAKSGANILTQDAVGFGFQRKRIVRVHPPLLHVAEDRENTAA